MVSAARFGITTRRGWGRRRLILGMGGLGLFFADGVPPWCGRVRRGGRLDFVVGGVFSRWKCFGRYSSPNRLRIMPGLVKQQSLAPAGNSNNWYLHVERVTGCAVFGFSGYAERCDSFVRRAKTDVCVSCCRVRVHFVEGIPFFCVSYLALWDWRAGLGCMVTWQLVG